MGVKLLFFLGFNCSFESREFFLVCIFVDFDVVFEIK